MAPPLRNSFRDALLRGLKTCGVFELVKNSNWRRERLLILCYHGIAQEDEHQWRPYLFVSRAQLERRFQTLHDGGYSVLPLHSAVESMYKGDLPPRSVVLTFDDGTYDFYRQCYPLLAHYKYPATVYLTTYYSGRRYPVFHLICSYMLWKRRDRESVSLTSIGVNGQFDLRREEERGHIEKELVAHSERAGLNGDEKNQLAAKLAHLLAIDYEELCSKRILQLMGPEEVGEVAKGGVDIQLHTHRHRTPLDPALFRKEIEENRAVIRSFGLPEARHFCYPSGAYRPEFLPWLSRDQIISATTCDTGLATRTSTALLLPRLVDTTGRSQLMFESWLAGVGQFISLGKRARLAYAPGQRKQRD